jgi:rubrerythrin
MELGQLAGQVVSGMSSPDPVEQAEAKEQVAEMAFSAVGQVVNETIQEEKQQARAAKEHGGEELSRSHDFPTCGECGAVIKHLPDQPKFSCPGCDVVLEHPSK